MFDDGVIARLDANRFIVSCSTSHVAGVHSRFEDWRQDQFDPARVYIHNATANWATLTFAGPASRKLVERLDLDVDLSEAALPHMALALGRFGWRASASCAREFHRRALLRALRARFAGRKPARARARGGPRSRRSRCSGSKPHRCCAPKKASSSSARTATARRCRTISASPFLRYRRADDSSASGRCSAEVAPAPSRRQLVGLETLDAREPFPCGAHVVDL